MSYPQIESIIGKQSPYLFEIDKMRREILAIPFETFYEPVSVIDASHKKRKIIGLSPELVHAWVKHVSYSSRVRMINIEQGILSELDSLRILTSMILARSHVEASGFACLCHNELKKCIETGGDSAAIEELIPQMLLGTSMVRAQKKDDTITETLLFSEQDKIPIGRLISALDDFMFCGEPSGHAHSLYGFLCEFTHPNMRSVMCYFDTEEHEEEGWYNSYRFNSKMSRDEVEMVLHILIRSMKAGYSACEFLNRFQFHFEVGNTYIGLPDEEDVKKVWETFFKWPENLKDKDITSG